MVILISNILIRKTGIYFIGNIASKVMMAVIIPVYAFFVTPSAVGNYDYWLSLAQIASPILYFAIWEAILKFLISNEDAQYHCAAKGTVLLFSIGMTIVAAILVVFALFGIGLELQMTISIFTMCVSSGLLQVWQYFARSEGMSKIYATSGVIASIATFMLILVLVCALALQEFGLVVAYTGGQFLALCYLERKVHLFRLTNFLGANFPCLKKFLSYSTPCVFNLIAGLLTLTVGRMLIINYLGSDANGLYAFGLKFANVVTAFGNIFSMAVIEEGILRVKAPRADIFFTHVSSALLTLLSSAACIGLPAIAIFYDLIGSTEYSASFVLIPLSLLYSISSVMAVQFGSVFMAMGKTSNQAFTTVASLIVVILVSTITIAPFGVTGVMSGLVIGTFFMAVLRYALAHKIICFHVNLKSIVILAPLYCVLIAILYFTSFGTTFVCHLACLAVACAISIPFSIRAIKAINNVPDV